jgi:UTP-glucose-1-phosphate uridylyltransferase
MRIIIFCFHLTFITSIEDHLLKKVKFLYIGKNVDDDYKQDICDKFNNFDEYRVVLIDLSEDISKIKFTVPNAVVLFAEMYWNADLMTQAEDVVAEPGIKPTNNIIFVFGRYTLDEYIFKLLYKQNPVLY